jgi:hypothetical protein
MHEFKGTTFPSNFVTNRTVWLWFLPNRFNPFAFS